MYSPVRYKIATKSYLHRMDKKHVNKQEIGASMKPFEKSQNSFLNNQIKSVEFCLNAGIYFFARGINYSRYWKSVHIKQFKTVCLQQGTFLLISSLQFLTALI